MEAHNATDGASSGICPPTIFCPAHDWIPVFGPALTEGRGSTFPPRAEPCISGAIRIRIREPQERVAFYGLSDYLANPQAYNCDGLHQYADHLRSARATSISASR